ncbi:hypothetical protein MTO96_004093 [Rhipicephalus appendiculatus]
MRTLTVQARKLGPLKRNRVSPEHEELHPSEPTSVCAETSGGSPGHRHPSTTRPATQRAEEDKATGEVKVKQRGSFAQSGVADAHENAGVPYRAWQLKWIRRSQLFEASVTFRCSILLSICGTTTVQAGYQGHSGFLLPRVHETIVPRIFPGKPLGFPTVSARADTFPPPNLAAGTFHGIPPVLERYPLPSYPLGPPLTKTHVVGTPSVHLTRSSVVRVSPVPVIPVHSAFVPPPTVLVKQPPPSSTVGGAIVGGRPAVRTFTPRIPAVTKVLTPVVVHGSPSKPLYPPHPYEFGYDTVDEYGNTQYRHETSDAQNNKRGSYGYTDANGIYRRVDYVADANGFRAHIRTNEPGTASSAPAGAVYDSKPVTISATVTKSQRGGLILKAGSHDGRSNAGKELFVSPVKPHPAVVVPTVSFQGGPRGGHPTLLTPHPIATHLQGPPTALVNNDSPVLVDGHPTVVDTEGSGGHHDAAEVVATKVLTDPARPHGVHATLGVVALQPHHHVHVAGHDYKAKSR